MAKLHAYELPILALICRVSWALFSGWQKKQRTRTAITETINSFVQKFRLVLRLSIGNNTWNLTYAHPIDSFDFDKSTQNKSVSELKTAKLGLIFYIF